MAAKKPPEPSVDVDQMIADLLDTGFTVSGILAKRKAQPEPDKPKEPGLSEAQVFFMGPVAKRLREDLMRLLVAREIKDFRLQVEADKPLDLSIDGVKFKSLIEMRGYLIKKARNEL